jgi:putative endonuclease
MSYYVYILFSPSSNRIYIGYTSDIEGRLLSHNKLAAKGWTIRFRPWTLVHSELFTTKREAMVREKQLKSAKGRDFIRKCFLNQ